MATRRVDAECFVTIGGKQYLGWNFIYLTDSSWEHLNDGEVVISKTELDYFANSEDFIDKSFVPNYDDEIYVAPNCSYALADIRKSYKVKRRLDDGVCNVYTHTVLREWSTMYRTMHYTLIDEDKRIIVCSTDYQIDKNKFRAMILEAVPELDASVAQTHDVLEEEWTLIGTILPEIHRKILTGGIKKPIIDIRKLPLRRENQLTFEQLDLILQVAHERWGETQRQNMLVQLNALNQYNWRDYTGTMSVFFKAIFTPRVQARYQVGGMVYKPSSLPKACRALVKQSLEDYQPFASDDDVKMAIGLLEKYFGTTIPEFVSLKSLMGACEKKNIPLDAVLHCYQNTLRLRPKTVSDNA